MFSTTTTVTRLPLAGGGHADHADRAGRGDRPHYRAPGFLTRHLMNPLVALATRLGLSVWGSRVLEVRGRTSGELRQTPVNLLVHDGVEYLVAPRGVTQWVRNLRVAGEGALRVGRSRTRFVATEVSDDEKPDVLRAYLERWKAEVGVFFDGVGPDSSDDELARIAPAHPVFRIEQVDGEARG